MADFVIGTTVACRDGTCGELKRVVVDPVARVLTHLVIGPRHRSALDHLVPIDVVASAGDAIVLRCTTHGFDTFEDAEETRFLPGASGDWDYSQDQMLSLPYFGLGMGGMGIDRMGTPYQPPAVTYDRVPVGEVEIHRGSRVEAVDGHVGKVHGLVIDPADHHVTHVLLDEGHLWGKKEVAVPIGAVSRVGDAGDRIALDLTKAQVRDLPEVPIARQ